MDTATTQLALSISYSCLQQRSVDPGGSQHWAFSCPISVDKKTSDALLRNLPPIQRLSNTQQLVKAGKHEQRPLSEASCPPALSLHACLLPVAGLCMKVTSHINELLVVHVMPVGTNPTDKGW
jgi:hypothetical protein